MISEFRFEHPGFLWLLLVVPPALAFFFGWASRQRQKLLSQFIDDRLLAGLTAGFSPARRKWKLACLVAASACLVVSLARPQWGSHWEESRQRGLDIVVAIDTSKSMLADDIAPNRLERAKLAAFDLMQQARSDRLGIVAFAGAAFLQCPLTSDDGAFKQCLDALDVNIIPEGGTAIAEAIGTAQVAFKGDAESYKVLVLFTDGEDQDSGALEAAQTAAKAGVRIFTVGIGNAEGEILRTKTENGQTDYVRDAEGNVVKSRLNETLLNEIATAANGFYLPMRGAGTIDTLYTQGLAPLPKSEGAARLTKRYHERFYWPLLLAILLLIAELVISERSRNGDSAPPANGKPKSAPAGSGKKTSAPKVSAPDAPASVAQSCTLLYRRFAIGCARKSPAVLKSFNAWQIQNLRYSRFQICATWAAAATLLAMMATAQASSSSAMREYQAGRYDNALKEYRQLLEKRRDDPRLNFNAGDAAYRDGQYEEAAKQFEGALSAKDLQLQQKSYFNRGNTFYQIGDRAQDPQEKQQSWEKAVQDYQSTLKLAPQDADAKHNLEFVKKKIEELKQQQQQQKQDKNDQKNDDQKKDDQKKDDQKQDQQKKDQQDQSSQDKKSDQDKSQQQKQDSSKQDKQDQKKQDQQKQDQQAQKQKEQEKKDQEQQSAGSKDKSSEEKGDEESVQARPGQMTPQQARQLLDAMKGEERMMPVQIEKRGANRTLKDW